MHAINSIIGALHVHVHDMFEIEDSYRNNDSRWVESGEAFLVPVLVALSHGVHPLLSL